MRNKLVLGNWKMHKTLAQACEDFAAVSQGLNTLLCAPDRLHGGKQKAPLDVGIAAPSVFLSPLATSVFSQKPFWKYGQRPLQIYAQNCHGQLSGAFTGDISPLMLKDLKVRGTLLGHSERRYADTLHGLGQRLHGVLNQGLEAVLCLGETLQERQGQRTHHVLQNQLTCIFEAGPITLGHQVLGSARPLLSLAYEPVWAIGTGLTPSPDQVQDVHTFLRQQIQRHLGPQVASCVRIVYGGSVSVKNVHNFVSCPDVDGVLVGGASLDPQNFLALCQQVYHHDK